MYPDIAQKSEFAWDAEGRYLGNTNYFVPTGDKYFCALLNSSIIGFLLGILSPQLRGYFFRYFTQYMEQLPIVEPYESDKQRLEALVDQLQAIGGVGPQAEAFEREVDQIIYRTYGLTSEEIAEIERWHAERRALLARGKRSNKDIGDNDDVNGTIEEMGQGDEC